MPPPTNALGFGPAHRGNPLRGRPGMPGTPSGTGGFGLLQNPTPQPRYGGQDTGGQTLLQQPAWAAPPARVQPFSNVARQPAGPPVVQGPGLRGAPSDSYLTGRMGEPLPTPGPTRAPDTGALVRAAQAGSQAAVPGGLAAPLAALPGAYQSPGLRGVPPSGAQAAQEAAQVAARAAPVGAQDAGLQAAQQLQEAQVANRAAPAGAPTAAAPGLAAAIPLASQLYGPMNAQLSGAARALGPARRPEWGPRR
jgi:hypothetical protein